MDRKKKILVIDDDRSVSELFTKALTPKGFEVLSLEDPDRAIEIAGDFHPDLIYLSLLFPASNGLKVGKALHNIGGLGDVPIVMLISYRGEIDPK
ncbi:MAG: response regulator, partial [Nitrospirae bacterium]|nr:response regulator [Nitrospirota bacterium]